MKLLWSFIELIILTSYDCCGSQKDTTIYLSVDSMPEFKYKDCKVTEESVDLVVKEHLIWPKNADFYAKIYIKCIVEKDGSLTNYKVLKSVEDNLDKASIDILKLMPKWKPGIKNGRIVRTQIIIPIIWKLS